MLKNQLRKFFIKLLWFTLTVGTADQIMGVILRRAYFSQPAGFDYQTTEAIRLTTVPTLVLGSSRAMNIISSERMLLQLGDSCFNAGMAGQSTIYQLAILKTVLRRYTPKRVLLCVDAGGLVNDRKAYDRLARLLPYYHDDSAIREAVLTRSPWEPIKMISGIYPFNSKLLDILRGVTSRNEAEVGKNGFIALQRTATAAPPELDYTKPELLDSLKIDAYRQLLSACRKSGVKVYVVCPPYRVNAMGTDASLMRARDIAVEMGITYYDFFADSNFLHRNDWFADFRHLNGTGAKIFTDTIAARILRNEQH